MNTSKAAAGVASLTVIACAAAYIIKGSIPDALTLMATTSIGGFFGVTIPYRQQ